MSETRPSDVAAALLKRLAAPRDEIASSVELKAAGVHTQLTVDMNAPPTIRPALSNTSSLPDPSKASLVRIPIEHVSKECPNPIPCSVKDISSIHLEVQPTPPFMRPN